MSDKQEYYVLKCPYCDADITKVMEKPSTTVECLCCEKKLNLYSVFGYNMWLSENGKSIKVDKKPIKDVKDIGKIIFEYCNDEESLHSISSEEYLDEQENENDDLDEDYLKQSSLMQKHPKIIHELLSFNADICTAQYEYLIKRGFTRPEAMDIIQKLIEQDFIL